MTDDDKDSHQEFVTALRESNKSILASVREKMGVHGDTLATRLDEHSAESRESLRQMSAEHRESVLELKSRIKEVGQIGTRNSAHIEGIMEIVRPIPQELGKLGAVIDHLKTENDRQWKFIYESRAHISDADKATAAASRAEVLAPLTTLLGKIFTPATVKIMIIAVVIVVLAFTGKSLVDLGLSAELLK